MMTAQNLKISKFPIMIFSETMLDFFSIFTKGGLVLWYFQAECLKINLEDAINQLIRYAIIDVSQNVY